LHLLRRGRWAVCLECRLPPVLSVPRDASRRGTWAPGAAFTRPGLDRPAYGGAPPGRAPSSTPAAATPIGTVRSAGAPQRGGPPALRTVRHGSVAVQPHRELPQVVLGEHRL